MVSETYFSKDSYVNMFYIYFAQLAGTVEYTDCISAEG